MDIKEQRDAFEEAWKRQQEAVERLGWLPGTITEKAAAWWGWKTAKEHSEKSAK